MPVRTLAVLLALAFTTFAAAEDSKSIPLSPAESLQRIKAPQGFQVTLFAGEPDVVQPIAMTLDDRGRLWVAECLSYPKWQETGSDRIAIFEDTDGDGRFDKKKIFWDKGRYLTGIQLGFGGVFICNAPDLAFIPDTDGDDVPDGEPVVLLDGWSIKGKHNVLNALKWGPDGWLYGCNGITAPSKVGKPGTPDEKRVEINCGVWRWHPVRKEFEVVAHGTTNPWGLDWDAYGQMFITNCVIKHIFHIVPGGHYERMFGNDINPHSYQLMPSCADHIHWAEGTKWTDSRGGKGAHDTAGGGHAHAGLMIYQGDNWPAEYRGNAFIPNVHGARVNRDTLERAGSGYVARHNKDFLFANDDWFRGLEMISGPDGGVYITDWHDTGECHDYDKAEVTTGRIYKITYGQTKGAAADVARLSSVELADLQTAPNQWYARQARRLLHERAARGEIPADAAARLDDIMFKRNVHDPIGKLNAAWARHVAGGLKDRQARLLLMQPEPQVRAWTLRLLLDGRQAGDDLLNHMAAMAQDDPSPVVRLELASLLQRLPLEKRWPLAEALLAHEEDAKDANIPLMIWYGIEPAVAADKERATRLLAAAKIPLVRQFIARRLAGDVKTGK